MAELSAEDAQRLARQFLTGKAGPADVARLSAALPEDPTLALELLAQMQAALDDVAPSALTAEQDRSVDARIEALIAPRIRKRGLFGWLRKLFGAKPPSTQPSRRRARNEPVRREPEELPPPVSAPPVEDGLEETMPGASAPEPEAPVSRARRGPDRAAAPGRRRSTAGPALGTALLVLLLLAGAAWGVRWWLQRPAPAPVAVPAAPTPVPTPTVTPVPGPPQRARSIAGQADEILPAHLPPTTPRPAGQLSPQP